MGGITEICLKNSILRDAVKEQILESRRVTYFLGGKQAPPYWA